MSKFVFGEICLIGKNYFEFKPEIALNVAALKLELMKAAKLLKLTRHSSIYQNIECRMKLEQQKNFKTQ